MSTVKQITALVKQELQSARRTRYVIFTFILMPLVMWGLQGGIQMIVALSMFTSQEGETIYVVSYDEGNGSFNLGDVFIDRLINETQQNDSILSGAIVNQTKYADLTYSDLLSKINSSETVSSYTPCIIIPENFTIDYLAYNATSTNPIPPRVELYTKPGGIIGSSMLEAGIYEIIYQYPFTFHVPTGYDKFTYVSQKTIVFEGEEGAASGFGIGFIGMISIMVAVFAPAPFVSTSFAGEREKKTMESLLALPISRFNILLSKVLAGLVLVGIFAIMNIFGLLLFSTMINFIGGNGSEGAEEYSSVFAIDPSPTMMLLVVLMMFLSAFVAIGIGISLASLTKDVRSAESMYTMFMYLPAIGVSMIGLLGGLPEQAFGEAGFLLYLIPWTHAFAILSKGLYPKTFESSALTGSIPLDLVLHFGYLIIVIMICLFVASKVFDREGILT
ncbi:MAG: ABC transporter permease [Candidatus Hodarchaeota archaeon]